MEDRQRQLEGPGHTERLSRIRTRFRALADADKARLAAARRERWRWLHKSKGRAKFLALAEPANARPNASSAEPIEISTRPPQRQQRKPLSFAAQLGLVVIASAAGAWLFGAMFPPGS